MPVRTLSYQRRAKKRPRRRIVEFRQAMWCASAFFLFMSLSTFWLNWIMTSGGKYKVGDDFEIPLKIFGISLIFAVGAWVLRGNVAERRYASRVADASTNNLQALRIDYAAGQLSERDVLSDPIAQFARWFDAAREVGVREPNAMTLATVDAAGMPSARIVLLKSFDDRGFVFFTNYQSAKGHDLANNANVALLFFWETMERQVRVQGRAAPVSAEETAAYFLQRPRAARLGAWASPQSQPIASREVLDQTVADLQTKFADQEVPPPPHWGGYRVVPSVIEFWQGRPSRLHDRLQYRRIDGAWKMQRLAP